MSDNDRIEEVMEEWQERRDRGEPVDPDAVVLAHPEFASALRQRFAALSVLDRVLREGVPPTTPSPQKLGDYRIVRELGRGGMGVVYLAEQVSMERRVALKVLYPRITLDRAGVTRFLREARAAGKLHHTNIVPVYDLDQDGDTWFYAMEFVEGASLAALLDQERILDPAANEAAARFSPASAGGTAVPTPSTAPDGPESGTATPSATLGGPDRRASWYRRVAEIFAGAADGLQAAHDGGVVHRDVKPSNLILALDGHLKLIDFGLALMESESGVTGTGERPGTPMYMSPEQARGGQAGPASDIWSLGATLYETLTLRPPFPGRDTRETLAAILGGDPAAPRRVDRRIPRDLETIVHKCLEKEPERRFAKASALATDLRRFADGGVIGARRIGPIGRMWRRAKRHKARTALLATAASAVLGSIWLAAELAASRPAVEAQERQTRLARSERLLELAFSEFGHGSNSVAIHLFEQAIGLNPVSVESVAGLALAHAFQRDHAAVLKTLDAHPRCLEEVQVLQDLRAMSRKSLGLDLEGFNSAETVDEPDSAIGCFLGGIFLLQRGHAGVGDGMEPDGPPPEKRACFEQAQELFYRAILRSPAPRAVYHFHLAHAAGHTGDLPTVNRAVRSLTTMWPKDALSWTWAAFALRKVNPARSLELHRRAVALEPRSLQANEYLASELQLQGRLEDATNAYRATLAINDGLANCWSNLGRVLRLQKKFLEALASHERALALTPDDAGALSEYSDTLQQSGEVEKGLAAIRRAIELAPDSFKLHMNLGGALARGGDEAAALASYIRASELAPETCEPHWNRAIALERLGRLDEAADAARRAVAVDPRSADAHFELGNVLMKQDRMDEAEEHLAASVALRPGRAEAYSNLGHCYMSRNRLRDALRCFRRAADLDPSLPIVRYNLGLVLYELQRMDEALPHLDAAWKEDPGDADSSTAFARCLTQSGRFREALEFAKTEQDRHAGRSETIRVFDDIRRVANLYATIDERIPVLMEGDLGALAGGALRALVALAIHRGTFGLAARAAQQLADKEPAGRPGLQTRYLLARSALLAGFDESTGDDSRDDESRAAWRRTALNRLRADISEAREVLPEGETAAERWANHLETLLGDPKLAPLRNPERLARLPADEAGAWNDFWETLSRTIATLDTSDPGRSR